MILNKTLIHIIAYARIGDNVTDIYHKTNLTFGSLSKGLKQLEDLGLIERVECNHYKKSLRITKFKGVLTESFRLGIKELIEL